jgi:heterodisulfide reductase subunit C
MEYQYKIMSVYYCLRFEVFTVVTMKSVVIWDVTPCGSCKIRCFRGTYLRHHHSEENQQARNINSDYQLKHTTKKG